MELTNEETRELAELITKRFGSIREGAEAWRRLFQSSMRDSTFEALLKQEVDAIMIRCKICRTAISEETSSCECGELIADDVDDDSLIDHKEELPRKRLIVKLTREEAIEIFATDTAACSFDDHFEIMVNGFKGYKNFSNAELEEEWPLHTEGCFEEDIKFLMNYIPRLRLPYPNFFTEIIVKVVDDVDEFKPQKPYFEIEKVGEYQEAGEGDIHTECELFREGQDYIKVFWTIYVRDYEGVAIAVGDYNTEEDAQEMLKLILVAAENPDEMKLAQLWEENDKELT